MKRTILSILTCLLACGETPAEKANLVFVSSRGFGPLEVLGISGVDEICVSEARAAGLDNPECFKAWISDGVQDPHGRFPKSDHPYVLVTGEVVAENWNDLTDGSLLHPINRSAFGDLSEVQVWTAVRTDGTGYDNDHCDGWTAFSGEFARHGWSDEVDKGWTDWILLPISCADGAKAYCFESCF